MGFIDGLFVRHYRFHPNDFRYVGDMRTGKKWMDFMDVPFLETVDELVMRHKLTMEDLKESEIVISDTGIVILHGKNKYEMII